MRENRVNINKLAGKLMRNRETRQALYAQLQQSQEDVFAQYADGTLDEPVLFQYLKRAQKHKELMALLPEILRFSDERTLSARVIRRVQALPANIRRNCVFAWAHCPLTVFQACILFSISPEYKLFSSILADMLRSDAYSLANVQLLVGFADGIHKAAIREVVADAEEGEIPAHSVEKVRWVEAYAGEE